MLTVVFILSVALIVYAYAGYPLSLILIRYLIGPKEFVYSHNYQPMVTILITAHNEEGKIGPKLDNTKNLDYPKDKLQIIIASDASTDRTDQLVRFFADGHRDYNILLERNPKNEGKEAAQKLALRFATGDITIITDVGTMLDTDTIKQLVGHFADERIGAVDGMATVITGDGEVSSEGTYLKYENMIRDLESQLGSLVSLGGCLFAARTNLLQRNFSAVLQSDFRTALMCVKYGLHARLDRLALAKFKDTKDPAKESTRKIRTVVRGINNFFNHLYLLNPFKYKLFAYQLFCHKMLKWLVPFFMITALVSNIMLVVDTHSVIWSFILSLHLLFYTMAIVMYNSTKPLFKLVSFFVMANVSILKAWILYFRGERFVSWKPTVR